MTGSGSKLTGLTKVLSQQWQQTKEYWHDAKAREFEHEYMEELGISVDRAVTVIEQLDKLLAKIKNDCE